MKKKKNELYDSFEVRFSKKNAFQQELFSYLQEKGAIIGKHNYLIQLLLEDYNKNKK